MCILTIFETSCCLSKFVEQYIKERVILLQRVLETKEELLKVLELGDYLQGHYLSCPQLNLKKFLMNLLKQLKMYLVGGNSDEIKIREGRKKR